MPTKKMESPGGGPQPWDRQASGFRDWYLRAHGPWWNAAEIATILSLAGPAGGLTLDAGCGTGRMLAGGTWPEGAWLGLDFSRQSLKVLRQTQGGRPVVLGDLRRIPLAEGTVDRVLSVQAVSSIGRRDHRARTIAEFHRVLRPGGQLVVTVYRHGGIIPKNTPSDGEFPGGFAYHAYKDGELRGELEAAGFLRVREYGVLNLLRLRRLGLWTARLEPIWARLGFSRHGGMYLLAVGRKAAGEA